MVDLRDVLAQVDKHNEAVRMAAVRLSILDSERDGILAKLQSFGIKKTRALAQFAIIKKGKLEDVISLPDEPPTTLYVPREVFDLEKDASDGA